MAGPQLVRSPCPVSPAQGIMLVYDITNEKSFDNIRNWIRNIEEVSLPRPALLGLPVGAEAQGQLEATLPEPRREGTLGAWGTPETTQQPESPAGQSG